MTRAPGAAVISSATRLSRIDAVEREVGRGGAAQTLAWSAHRFADRHRRVAEPDAERAAPPTGAGSSGPRTGRGCGRAAARRGMIRSSARPCRRDQRAVLHRPAETTRRQAEGGRGGQADHFLRRDLPRQQRADPVEERIAASPRRTPKRRDAREWPGMRLAAAMARPAFRRSRRRRPATRCRRPPTTSDACAISVRAAGERPSRPSSPIPMIDSQRRGARSTARSTGIAFVEQNDATSYPWRHDGGERPGAADCRPPGPRSCPVLRRPDAKPGAAADPVPRRRLWRRRRDCKAYLTRTPDRRGYRRNPSVRRPDVAQRRCRLPGPGVPLARPHPAGLAPAGRRSLDQRRRTWTAAVHALGERPRTVFLTIGGLQLAAFARAPQHHYIVRTIDPPDAIGALPVPSPDPRPRPIQP